MLRMIFVLFLYGTGTILGLRSAVLASCFFIWSDIFRPDAWARYHGILHPSTFMPVHIVTGVLLLSILIRPWKRRWNGGATAILVAIAWIFISALLCQYRTFALEKAIMCAKYFIPLAIISATLCTRWAQHMFLYTMAACVGVWMIHHGVLTVTSGAAEINMGIPGGQMSDRNDFMVGGTACIPLLLYIAFHYEGFAQRFVRPAMKVGLVFAVGALFLSLSRGAVLGFSALLLWYGLWTGRLVKRFATVLLIVGIIAAVMPQFVWDRMTTIRTEGPQTESSARSRMKHMKTAVDVTLDYPLTGVGASNYPYVALRYGDVDAEPHSLWLKASAELGLPMVIFFVLLVIAMLRRLKKYAKSAAAIGNRKIEAMATALSCSLVGYLATGTFTSQFLGEYLWAIIALIGAFLATPLEQPTMTDIPEEAPPTRALAGAAG